ncbi:DUF3159 domain-containing protein [Corynebacterium caspium]|uniref:DUF3159 domain-containing protein n=1 Tax=Corynebacterium caspium TaxID=234828 RepID=UPI000380FA94|nr:DUF3159 domain-containing protein [Corynebacterium caspium]WKD59156.1 hypothetical protein CCASP_03760 [Corynebacterium caspium DSM 44850]
MGVEPQDKTVLEQMGGVNGIISSTLPIFVLVPVNSKWGLVPALVSALGVAALVLIWSLIRKTTLQPAISGFIGVAICAGIAWWTGEAKGYFLYGIWMSLIYGIICLVSVVLKWPLVGLIWEGINAAGTAWRNNKELRRAYSWATIAWGLVSFARFYVQHFLYNGDNANILAFTRIAMGLPLTAALVIFCIVLVRRAKKLTPVETPPEILAELEEKL